MMQFLRKWFGGETDGLTSAAILIGGASLVSRIVGVFRDRILASTFGAGSDLDAYYAAFRLPDLFFQLIILGALSAGFIPIFTEILTNEGKEAAHALARTLMSLVAIIMASISFLLFIVAPCFMPWIAPGFSSHTLTLAIALTQIMAISPFLLGLSAVSGGILQSMRRYIPFALAPILYNVGIIFGVLVLSPEWGMYGVAWGVVLGAALHLLAQASVSSGLGMGGFGIPSLSLEPVRRMLRLMVPRMIGLGINQINLVIILSLASTLATGSIAVMELANNLQSFAVSLIGISFAIAAFPLLSRAFSYKDEQEFSKLFQKTAHRILFLIIPVTGLFILLRAQIVRLILGQGRFDWNDTKLTASVLGWFAVSFVAQCLIPLIARAYYARQNTKTPLLLGALAQIGQIILAITLRDSLGVRGLVVAFSIAAYLQLILLWIWMRKHVSLSVKKECYALGKILLASIALMITAYPVRVWIGTIYPLRTFWQVALQLCASASAGIIVYILVSWFVRSQELQAIIQGCKRHLVRSPSTKEGMDEAKGI